MRNWLVLPIMSALLSIAFRPMAQTNEQLWFEHMLNIPFANAYNFESAVAYSTLLGNPKWRAFDYAATLEYSVMPHIDLIGQMLFSYTNQEASYNTFEIRPALGTRIFITPNRRIQTRLLLRVEQRNFENLETKTWEQVYRPRARIESLIPINKDSYFKDKLWYGILDAEFLFVSTDVEERFANRDKLKK